MQFFEKKCFGLFFEPTQPSKKEGNQKRKFKKAQTNTTLNLHVLSDSLLLITYNEEEDKEDKEEDGEDEKKKRIIIE